VVALVPHAQAVQLQRPGKSGAPLHRGDLPLAHRGHRGRRLQRPSDLLGRQARIESASAGDRFIALLRTGRIAHRLARPPVPVGPRRFPLLFRGHARERRAQFGPVGTGGRPQRGPRLPFQRLAGPGEPAFRRDIGSGAPEPVARLRQHPLRGDFAQAAPQHAALRGGQGRIEAIGQRGGMHRVLARQQRDGD
jgi:hypothetical protein